MFKKPLNEIFRTINELTILAKQEDENTPHDEKMLSITEDTGRFFNLLLKATNKRNLLEIGTSVGYSTLWFAEAMTYTNGMITTIEQLPKKIQRAKNNFKKAKITNVNVIQGNALQVLQDLQQQIKSGNLEKFDFVFIDADKENVIEYFDLALEIIEIGGIVATDNILYPERFRPHMTKLVDHIKSIRNVQTVTVPIGNGEEISLKIA